MLDINGTDIEINKRNAGVFTITLTGDDVPGDGTEILFVVRRSPNHTVNLLSKSLVIVGGVLTVQLDPEDTQELSVNAYYWNLIIKFDNGDAPWAVSKRALKFIVLPEIGSGET